MNNGEELLSSPSIIAYLKEHNEQAIMEIRNATLALAFDFYSAVGFYIYRAIEKILEEYLVLFKIMRKRKPSFGGYIDYLKKHNVDAKITGILDHIRDNYRNDIIHPNEFWNAENATTALGLALSAILIIVPDIMRRKALNSMAPESLPSRI